MRKAIRAVTGHAAAPLGVLLAAQIYWLVRTTPCSPERTWGVLVLAAAVLALTGLSAPLRSRRRTLAGAALALAGTLVVSALSAVGLPREVEAFLYSGSTFQAACWVGLGSAPWRLRRLLRFAMWVIALSIPCYWTRPFAMWPVLALGFVLVTEDLLDPEATRLQREAAQLPAPELSPGTYEAPARWYGKRYGPPADQGSGGAGNP